PAHFTDLHAPVFRLPLVEGHRADSCSPAQVFHWSSTLGFPQNRDDLLFGEPTPLHAASPFPCLYPEKLTFAWISSWGAGQGLSHPQSQRPFADVPQTAVELPRNVF